MDCSCRSFRLYRPSMSGQEREDKNPRKGKEKSWLMEMSGTRGMAVRSGSMEPRSMITVRAACQDSGASHMGRRAKYLPRNSETASRWMNPLPDPYRMTPEAQRLSRRTWSRMMEKVVMVDEVGGLGIAWSATRNRA